MKTHPDEEEMTIEEIQIACSTSRALKFSRHPLEAPELSLKARFYPYGFPAEVRTNSIRVLELSEAVWGRFEKQHDTAPIRSDVHVIPDESTECPPAPAYQIMLPLLVAVADANNYSIVDLEQCRSQTSLSQTALKHELYAKYFFLGTPAACVATRFATPVHAGCVAMDGRGVLLCGDSGAGKSTLSYACAQAGWTYITDDAAFLLNSGTHRIVTGNCHQVRFRPSAMELFPEISALEITPRAAGKPSIELATNSIAALTCVQSTAVDFVVFLNRSGKGRARLAPYSKDVARYFMRQVLWGRPEWQALQYEAIDHLLGAKIFELSYSDVDGAVDRLRLMVREG